MVAECLQGLWKTSACRRYYTSNVSAREVFEGSTVFSARLQIDILHVSLVGISQWVAKKYSIFTFFKISFDLMSIHFTMK